jgi:hypothetical protein
VPYVNSDFHSAENRIILEVSNQGFWTEEKTQTQDPNRALEKPIDGSYIFQDVMEALGQREEIQPSLIRVLAIQQDQLKNLGFAPNNLTRSEKALGFICYHSEPCLALKSQENGLRNFIIWGGTGRYKDKKEEAQNERERERT